MVVWLAVFSYFNLRTAWLHRGGWAGLRIMCIENYPHQKVILLVHLAWLIIVRSA